VHVAALGQIGFIAGRSTCLWRKRSTSSKRVWISLLDGQSHIEPIGVMV